MRYVSHFNFCTRSNYMRPSRGITLDFSIERDRMQLNPTCRVKLLFRNFEMGKEGTAREALKELQNTLLIERIGLNCCNAGESAQRLPLQNELQTEFRETKQKSTKHPSLDSKEEPRFVSERGGRGREPVPCRWFQVNSEGLKTVNRI